MNKVRKNGKREAVIERQITLRIGPNVYQFGMIQGSIVDHAEKHI